MEIENNKLIAEFMGFEYSYDYCDNCGMKNPELAGKSPRLTKCCSTYDKNNALAFYNTEDSEGKTIYSCGKKSRQTEPLVYHCNWNQLMKVINKIEKLGYWTRGQSSNNGSIYSFYIGKTGDQESIIKWRSGEKLEITYNTCIEFINWYNKYNK
jgi:hypothetical protein